MKRKFYRFSYPKFTHRFPDEEATIIENGFLIWLNQLLDHDDVHDDFRKEIIDLFDDKLLVPKKEIYFEYPDARTWFTTMGLLRFIKQIYEIRRFVYSTYGIKIQQSTVILDSKDPKIIYRDKDQAVIQLLQSPIDYIEYDVDEVLKKYKYPELTFFNVADNAQEYTVKENTIFRWVNDFYTIASARDQWEIDKILNFIKTYSLSEKNMQSQHRFLDDTGTKLFSKVIDRFFNYMEENYDIVPFM